MSDEQHDHSHDHMSQEELDHHANQHNPNNPAYRERMNNHAEQLNPNNWKYDRSRQQSDQE